MPYYILGTKIDCFTPDSAKAEIEKRLTNAERTSLFTPNLLMVGRAARGRGENILNRAELNIADGSGIFLTLKSRGLKNAERTAGIDMGLFALEIAAREGLRVYLLGGKPGVAESAAENLKRKISSLCICGVHHGYFNATHGSADMLKITREIKESRADVLVVCLGYPRQEKFILDVYNTLGTVRLFMGLGGSIDVWAEKVRRAPSTAQKLHLEWLWRCILQPRRFKDALALPSYFLRAVIRR